MVCSWLTRPTFANLMSSPLQQLLSHQVSVPRPQVLKVRFLPVMSTRQEVLEALRRVAEEVLASLKLASWWPWCSPWPVWWAESGSHGVPDEPCESADSRGGSATPKDRSAGEFDSDPVPAEAAYRSRTYREAGECSRIRQSLQPASSNANEAANAAIANDTKCPSTSRSDGKPSVFLRSFRDWKPTVTHASLESWGNKIVGFGKKHLRSRYAHVCESDPGYIKWILTWAGRQPLRGCGEFRKLCPSSQATGTIGQQSGPMRGNWEGFQESRMSHRTNFKERQLLNEADNMCMKSVTTKLNSWTS